MLIKVHPWHAACEADRIAPGFAEGWLHFIDCWPAGWWNPSNSEARLLFPNTSPVRRTLNGSRATFMLIVGLALSACGGSDTSTAQVPTSTATPTAPTIASFTATPATITAGQSSVLSWSTTGSTSLSISGVGSVNGNSLSVSPSVSTSYTLTATNATGSVTAGVTVIVQPAAGATITTISSPAQGGTTSGGGRFATGALVRAKAVPAAGYYFVGWTEGPYGAVVSNSATYDFSVTAALFLPDRSLVANFSPSATNAVITIRGQAVFFATFSGAGSYALGATATVVAPANMNGSNNLGAFKGWSENGVIVSSLPRYAFTVTGPRALEPVFVDTANAPLGVNISPTGDQVLVVGDRLNNVAAYAFGGSPPYQYQFTFENANGNSQAEVADVGAIGYDQRAAGADAYDPAATYAGPANYVAVKVTDSTGATATKKVRISVMPMLDGNVIAKPGRRAYRVTADGNANAYFLVYVPRSYSAALAAPAMFNEDGGISAPLQTAADAMNFILVAPPAWAFVSDPGQFHANMDSHEVTDLAIADRLFKGVNINRKHVLMTGHSRWGYPAWFLGAKHPEIFTELAFQCSNFYDDSILRTIWLGSATWRTRPIYQLWGQNDRGNVLTENAAAGTFLKNQVGTQKLTQYEVPGGGHGAYPVQVTEWWKTVLAQ